MKRRKKKIIIGLASCTMLAAVAAFINSNNSNTMSAMTLANVQALTEKEEFTWDGKVWNETDKHDYFWDWKPAMSKCQTQFGIPPFVYITEGQRVTCNSGDGNCYVSTSCVNG